MTTPAELARDEAMEQVEENADESWLASAWEAIEKVSTKSIRFTSDDVWNLLEIEEVEPPREPRALGPLMKRGVTYGLMEPTGRYIKSTRRECHARPVAEYVGTR